MCVCVCAPITLSSLHISECMFVLLLADSRCLPLVMWNVQRLRHLSPPKICCARDTYECFKQSERFLFIYLHIWMRCC